jgi:hypothetical protein
MRSSPGLGEQTVGSAGAPSSYPSAGRSDPRDEWAEAQKDPAAWVNDAVSAIPSCHPSETEPTPITSKGQNLLDSLITDAFDKDDSCRVVYTGNGDRKTPDSERVATADITYAKVMAYSMAEDMCASNEVHQSFNKRGGYEDALNRDEFNGKKIGKVSENDVAATYALTYALGYRESSGNFNQPRDPWAKPLNTGAQEEVGFTQTSANTLNVQKSAIAKNIFRSYVNKLAGMSSQKERASYCLNDKLEGNNQTRLIENDSKGQGRPIPFDHEGKKLNELFSKESSTCKKIVNKVKGPFTVSDTSSDIIGCYKELHKNCPGFSVKYGAAITRTNKQHQGPLRDDQSKPSPKPSCQLLFNSIIKNQEKLCLSLKEEKDSSNAGENTPGLSVDSKNDSTVKPEQGINNGSDTGTAQTETKKPDTSPPVIGSDGPSQGIRVESKQDGVNNPSLQLRQIKTTTGADVLLIESTPPGSSKPPLNTQPTFDERDNVKIIGRREWDPGWRNAYGPNGQWGPLGPVSRVTLHHTEGNPKASDMSSLKTARDTHIKKNGWSDVGYHFLIPREPVNGAQSVFEGAPITNKGQHAARNNTGNIGIALLGNINIFDPAVNPKGSSNSLPPTPYQEDTVRKLVKMLKKKYTNLQPIIPHKYSISPGSRSSWNNWNHSKAVDFSGQHTDCPGYGGLLLVKKLNAEGL